MRWGEERGELPPYFCFVSVLSGKRQCSCFSTPRTWSCKTHPFQHSAVQVLYIGMQSMCNKDSLEGATADQVWKMWPWQGPYWKRVKQTSLTITESISFCSFVIATAPYSIQGSSIGDLAGKSVDSLPKDGTAKRVLNLPKAVSAPITASCDCHWPIKVAKPDGGCDLLPFLCPAAFSFFYLSR